MCILVPGGGQSGLTNGHILTTDSQAKMSCSKVVTPTAPSTSMMVASEAVLLGDTADILSLCVGGDERLITKLHSQKPSLTSPPCNKTDGGYHANYSHTNGNAGVWGAHVKREQITQ